MALVIRQVELLLAERNPVLIFPAVLRLQTSLLGILPHLQQAGSYAMLVYQSIFRCVGLC
jgi:hypothetical protein